jgi:hypothetical protein
MTKRKTTKICVGIDDERFDTISLMEWELVEDSELLMLENPTGFASMVQVLAKDCHANYLRTIGKKPLTTPKEP